MDICPGDRVYFCLGIAVWLCHPVRASAVLCERDSVDEHDIAATTSEICELSTQLITTIEMAVPGKNQYVFT